MRAAQIDSYGDHTAIQVREVARPAPGAGQVVIEVHASGINPFDGIVLAGWMADQMPLAFPATLGGDFAGVVAELGEGVGNLAVGDPVFGGQANTLFGGSGALAEFVAVPADKVAKAPGGIDLALAAALPLAGVTAVQVLRDELRLTAGERILIHGASGNVGAAAVQIAKHLGATVVGTASAGAHSRVLALGADQVVDYSPEGLAGLTADFDAIFDASSVGPDAVLGVARAGGRVVSMTSAPDAGVVAERELLASQSFTVITAEKLNALRGLVETGVVTPHVAASYPLGDAAEAFRAKLSGEIHGRVALLPR
ncbi:NADP-dependent oxidoreductase [Microbacterium sp. NPDC077663]|uniref:NADP-dependent oxidoreductase n=1 Tax=Microbacterium sp. NPDC077663 TaxID=3364189 RepID=UPI0037CCA59F